MARGRRLGKVLQIALICLTIGVLIGVSSAVVNASADGYESNETAGEAAPSSTDDLELMPQAYSISGTVTNGSGIPIVGAMVSAFKADSILPAYDDTGADGSYSISLTSSGDYLVMAQASGFVPEYYNNVYDQNLATEVTVTFSGSTGIDFTLGPAGSISGVVKNEAGDPLHYAKVKAQGNDFTTYDYTGADGTYEVNGLTPGSYVVWAQASGYFTEYYNNVYDSSSATPVTVTALNDTSGIDFTLGTGGSPAVTTYDATSVTVSSARLNGNLTSLGTATSVTVSFQWGTSSGSYPNETTGQVMTSTGAFYSDLGSLTHSTTYYYQAKAVGDSTVYGVERSFTTLTPPTVITNYATSVDTTSATLNGSLTSLGTASSVTVSFIWGTTPGSYPNETTSQAKTSTGTFYFNLPGLAPGTAHYYKAKAVGDGTVYGVEIGFTTTTTPPTVATDVPTDIVDTSATLNGSLDDLGTAAAVQVSFEWGLTASYGNITTPQTMTGTGAFSDNIGGLTTSTYYYYRAKAAGDGDPVYGSGMIFRTGPRPSVTTYAASHVTTGSARLNGYLTSLGNASSVAVSFVWGTTSETDPEAYSDETTSENVTSTGAFYFDLGGLDPTTIYYCRAKAVGDGTSYGIEMSFSTFPPSPLVTTNEATQVTTSSARLNGDLTWLGTASSVTVSSVWGTTSETDPEAYSYETTSENMTSLGPFYFDLSDLSPGTTYYYRAKAVGDGTSWGVERSFTTLATPPSVTTDSASDVTTNSARLNGNLTSLGTASSVQVSFEWWVTDQPVSTTTPQTMAATGAFYFDLSALSPGTSYHYRAKAVVGDGNPVYGSDKPFNSRTPPSVTTDSASNVSSNSARLNGNLTWLGTADTVTVSFVWGTVLGGPYPNETTVQLKTSPEAFYFDLGGLDPSTTYYYLAKAVGDGTGYGAEMSYTTSTPPTVATNDTTQVSASSARLTGDLTSLGTASSVTVSFEWGISSGSYPNETAGIALTATGTFYSDLSGLSAGTTYYYRAKATGDGTSYGAEKSLATGHTPDIVTVDPSRGKQGQHLTITISGSNFDGATGVTFGSGITVEDFDFSSSEIIAEIAIDGDAEVGVRDVSVTTGWGTGTKQDGFDVVGGGGGICSCSSSKAPGVRSEMTPTLAAIGLVLGAGYWFVRRSKRNRQE